MKKVILLSVFAFLFIAAGSQNPCSTPACQTNRIILNSGYDHSISSPYTIGQQDGFWRLVKAPTWSGLSLPMSPFVINPMWGPPFIGSQWLSPYQMATFGQNNPIPDTPFLFELPICVCPSPVLDSADIVFSVKADNDAQVYWDNTQIFTFPNNNAVSNFTTGGSVVVRVALTPGPHYLRVGMRNISGGLMGWNGHGTMTVVPVPGRTDHVLVTPGCCIPNGSICGRKIWDKNCNGKDDNTTNNQNIEPGLKNWVFTLNPGNITVTSDTFGYFCFTNIPAGTYTLTEVNQTGWTQSQPAVGGYTITLTGNQSLNGYNFLNCKGVVGPPICDEFSKGTLDTNCCEYNFGISNNPNNNITSIRYTITGGNLNSLSFLPCTYNSVPANLFGTTTGLVTFSPTCTNTMNANIQITPNTASGLVCINWVTYHKNGDSCVYRTCYNCEPAPKTHCDSMSVVPFPDPNLTLSGRTFTFYNQKVPVSPISWIKIIFTPAPATHQGGLLYVNGTPHFPKFIFPYNNVPNAVAANFCVPNLNANTVRFNLGVDYTLNWTGTVTFVIYHCDGDSCTTTYGPWKAQPGANVVVIDKDVISDHLHATKFFLKGNSATQATPIKWFTVSILDTSAQIWAVGSNPDTRRTYSFPHVFDQKGRIAMFELDTPTYLKPDSSIGPIQVVVSKWDIKKSEVWRVNMYDNNSNIVYTDTITISSASSTGVGKILKDVSGIDITVSPNPAKDLMTVTYSLANNTDVMLELLDSRGIPVELLINKYHERGKYNRDVIISNYAAGVYYLRLQTDSGEKTIPVVITQ